jgi:NAD(P)-dependent dehydrogenase (short-subunit alcohol dehydrogenase family)
MSKQPHPEVVVITGARAGLGRAIVEAFAKRGAHIGLVARERDGLEQAARDVEALGGKALALPTDVADAEQVEHAAAVTEATFGPIDIWVNDAMTSVFSPFKKMTADEYKRVTDVTYLGYVYGTMAALKRMLPRDQGTIVQVGSALAYRGIPLQSAYCGAKHAIQGFTEAVRCELLHDKSKVWITMVQMPALNTPQFDWVKNRLPHKAQPVPPIFQPEVGAAAVYWAAHHHRREIYVGGSTLIAILGNRILPNVGDWYLGRTGYQSQQVNSPADHERPDDLWEPVPGNFGAHGRFDSRATNHSPQLWVSEHRNWLVAGAGAVGAASLALLTRKR